MGDELYGKAGVRLQKRIKMDQKYIKYIRLNILSLFDNSFPSVLREPVQMWITPFSGLSWGLKTRVHVPPLQNNFSLVLSLFE